MAVTVTSVSTLVGRVAIDAWNPKTLLLAGAVNVCVGTMDGWLLDTVNVGPPVRERPLMSIWPSVLSPPVMGLKPVIRKSPSVGIGAAGAGFGGSMTSHRCPALPFVIRNGGIDALYQKPCTSTNWIDGTYEVATSKGTVVAPVVKVMPLCGKLDELKFGSRSRGTPTS